MLVLLHLIMIMTDTFQVPVLAHAQLFGVHLHTIILQQRETMLMDIMFIGRVTHTILLTGLSVKLAQLLFVA